LRINLDGTFEGLTRLEGGNLGCGYFDLSTGSRVSANAGSAFLGLKRAETNHLHFIAGFQCLFRGGEESGQRSLAVLFGKATYLCHGSNHINLVHNV